MITFIFNGDWELSEDLLLKILYFLDVFGRRDVHPCELTDENLTTDDPDVKPRPCDFWGPVMIFEAQLRMKIFSRFPT